MGRDNGWDQAARAEAGLRTDLVLVHLAAGQHDECTPRTDHRPADRRRRRLDRSTTSARPRLHHAGLVARRARGHRPVDVGFGTKDCNIGQVVLAYHEGELEIGEHLCRVVYRDRSTQRIGSPSAAARTAATTCSSTPRTWPGRTRSQIDGIHGPGPVVGVDDDDPPTRPRRAGEASRSPGHQARHESGP